MLSTSLMILLCIAEFEIDAVFLKIIIFLSMKYFKFYDIFSPFTSLLNTSTFMSYIFVQMSLNYGQIYSSYIGIIFGLTHIRSLRKIVHAVH